MKILWVTNLSLPRIEQYLHKKSSSNGGGWLIGLSENLLALKEYQLIVCYPCYSKENENGKIDNLSFYGINVNSRKINRGTENTDKLIEKFVKILSMESPDVIHIQGSEYQYSYAAACAAQRLGVLNRVVVSIQGMVSVYAQHAFADLPYQIVKRKSIKEYLSFRGMVYEKKYLLNRGKYEVKLLELVSNVIGRTTWDKACTFLINPQLHYFRCNETLRNPFYSGQWKYELCEKHSVFVSQGTKPIKGLHKLIEAVIKVKEYYPDLKIYVAGNNIINNNVLIGNSYGKYLGDLIEHNYLHETFVFTGSLNAEDMKSYMLRCNAFVLPSSIENSPNSLGEAMLLGVPCISSDVGGVSDMMIHQKEGYVYPFNEEYMLAYYLVQLFKLQDKAAELGINAHKHACITHDETKNLSDLLTIYDSIMGGNV